MVLVLEELTRATGQPLPETDPGPEYWEALVRAAAKLGDTAWARLSRQAMAWVNAGVHTLKPAGEDTPAAGGPRTIEPLELPEPSTDSRTVEDDEGDNDLALEILDAETPAPAPVRGRPPAAEQQQPSRRRAQSFRKGKMYGFARFLLTRPNGLEGLDAASLADEYNVGREGKAQLSARSANAMLYDLIVVVRALRDLRQYEHPIAAEISSGDA